MPSTDDDEVEKMKVLSLDDTNRLVHYCLNSSSPWAIPTLISAMTGGTDQNGQELCLSRLYMRSRQRLSSSSR